MIVKKHKNTSNHVLIETFTDSRGQKKLLDIPVEGLRLNIDEQGFIVILETEEKCHLCNGSGGTRYWYAQDESTGVACPICGGGDQVLWDREKKRWEKSRH